jgi:hypothetical protein
MADSPTSKRRLLVSLFAAVVVVGVAVVIWQAASGDDEPEKAAPPQQSSKSTKQASRVVTDPQAPGYDAAAVPTIPSAQPAERANFALLRTEPDGMPAKSLKVMGKPIYGLNPDLAKNLAVEVPARYGRFWFAPADKLMCVVAHNYPARRVNLKCALTKDALTKGVVGTFIQTKGGGAYWGSLTKQLIVGVAPDGVRKARVTVGPETATVPVVDNLFFHTARSHENPEITYQPTPHSS